MPQKITIAWLLCQVSWASIAQVTDTLQASISEDSEELSYADQLFALEEELDSLSIFNLIDSVLLQNNFKTNQLNLRFGLTSSVTSAGRDYDIQQTGYSAGLSYFHNSGLYADLAGYWNTNVEPAYNPTILSGGYLGSFSSKWSYSVDYEHWFFNPKDSSDNNLSNSIGTSLNYDFKIGYISLDYSYLFGKETANRIIPSLTWNIKLGKWGKKNVTLFPTFSMMIGNGDITTLRITTTQISDQQRALIEGFNHLSTLTDREREQLKRYIANNPDIPTLRKNRLLNIITYYEELDPTPEELALLNEQAANGIRTEEYVDGEEFGILNYSISIPLSISSNRFSFLFSYTYSIPVKLPSEIFDVEPVGYFGASISYRIPY